MASPKMLKVNLKSFQGEGGVGCGGRSQGKRKPLAINPCNETYVFGEDANLSLNMTANEYNSLSPTSNPNNSSLVLKQAGEKL